MWITTPTESSNQGSEAYYMKESKGETKKLFVYEIFRVLYSPFKAFKEIVKKPDVKGPVLILLITVLATDLLIAVAVFIEVL